MTTTLTTPERDTAIRPFRIEVPEETLVDLRQRIATTRWPDKETVSDRSQGVQLAKIKDLARYWATDYDWRTVEATLNALPQFITEIDGLDIQFAHIRSPHDDALPLLMTHGWPGSIIELLKVIEPLTNPTAHGGRAEDAFHLVLPTLPGYGFSDKPTATGWRPARMASAFHELMLRLGYPRYVSQGGDWGAIVTELLAARPRRDSSASTSTCPGPCRRRSCGTCATSNPPPRSCRIGRRSPTTGSALLPRRLRLRGDDESEPADDRLRPRRFTGGDGGVLLRQVRGVDRYRRRAREDLHLRRNARYHHALLGHQHRHVVVTLVLGGRPGRRQTVQRVRHPDSPGRRSPSSRPRSSAPRGAGASRASATSSIGNEVDKGGHFAAWEQPQLFSEELRSAFRSLR